MHTKVTCIIAFLCTVILCCAGCQAQHQPKEDPTIMESQIWETMPALNYGVIEYEKLEVLPWYSGRLEATGYGRWAETKDGFYLGAYGLRYCDKDNMRVCVAVCHKPDCSHSGMQCNAKLGWGTFQIRSGRIYFCGLTQDFPVLYLKHKDGYVANAIFSIALDGSDGRFEYEVEESVLSNGGGFQSLMRPGYWVQNATRLEPDGTYIGACYYMTEDGLQVLHKNKYDSNQEAQALLMAASFCGDSVFYNGYLGSELYRVKNGEIIEVKAAAYEEMGGYLSGNVLRQFRPGEGYYDIDLNTGEEVLVSKPRFENSVAKILLPNCIIETTLGASTHPDGTEHGMEFFDGIGWRTVSLPEELQNISGDTRFYIQAVASDRVFFEVVLDSGVYKYQMMLNDSTLTLEKCMQIR